MLRKDMLRRSDVGTGRCEIRIRSKASLARPKSKAGASQRGAKWIKDLSCRRVRRELQGNGYPWRRYRHVQVPCLSKPPASREQGRAPACEGGGIRSYHEDQQSRPSPGLWARGSAAVAEKQDRSKKAKHGCKVLRTAVQKEMI